MLRHGRIADPTLLHWLVRQLHVRRRLIEMQVPRIGTVIQALMERPILLVRGGKWRTVQRISNHQWFGRRGRPVRRPISVSFWLSQMMLQMHVHRIGQDRLRRIVKDIEDAEKEEYGQERRRDARRQEGNAKEAVLQDRHRINDPGGDLCETPGPVQTVPSILMLLL